jgi:chloramphenicol-sensitive protein RarD
LEIVAHRVAWSLVFVALLLTVLRGWGQVRAVLADRRALLVLAAAAVLIAVNWLVYVWAVQHGEVLAASLGYYINPLLNVVLGTVVLRERLNRRQWTAVALAACGVALLLGGAFTTLWISLTLATSFGFYGLLRKQVAVGSLPGLTIESIILLIPATGIAWFYAQSPAGPSFGQDLELSIAIMAGGVLTAIPLLLFALAARRMDYSLLSFIQFLSPTIGFILGLTVFDEPLEPIELACFVLIWAALAVFVWDLLTRRRAASVG